MSNIDVKKLDPFVIALGSVANAPDVPNAPDITKQQYVDALTLVINGKITQSWEQSNGMTKEKTALIQVKKELSELSFNGKEDVDESIKDAIQKIIMKLSVYKRLARKNAQQNAPADDDNDDTDDDNDNAVALDDEESPVEEYNDYSSSN